MEFQSIFLVNDGFPSGPVVVFGSLLHVFLIDFSIVGKESYRDATAPQVIIYHIHRCVSACTALHNWFSVSRFSFQKSIVCIINNAKVTNGKKSEKENKKKGESPFFNLSLKYKHSFFIIDSAYKMEWTDCLGLPNLFSLNRKQNHTMMTLEKS